MTRLEKCLHYAEVLGGGDAPKFRRKGLCADIILPSHASCAENFQGLLMAAGCSHSGAEDFADIRSLALCDALRHEILRNFDQLLLTGLFCC